MVVDIGIDSCTFERVKSVSDKSQSSKFAAMIGCAVITEDIEGFKKAYSEGLSSSLNNNGFTSKRKVLSSSEILTLTSGNFVVHEDLFKSVLPFVSNINVFHTNFNSKRIPKIKIYGRKKCGKELSFEEFYNSHLVNSFPHICMWKIYSYICGKNARVHVDNFQSEITDAWDIISQYPNMQCYTHGDMTNALISFADILCRLIDYRLEESNLFLNQNNISEIFPELDRKQLFIHLIGNQHLPRITNVHTNKVLLHNYMKRPMFHIYLGKETGFDKKAILNSTPNFLNYVHDKNGCIKFFADSDVTAMKNDDYVVYLNKDHKKEVDVFKDLWENQLELSIKAVDIRSLK